MSKLKTNKRLTPQQLLDVDAEKLAQEHQQRLHQMTRAAVYGKVKEGRKPAFALWPVAVPVLSLMAITLVWQLTQQPEVSSLQPVIALKENVPESAPDWVRDADVPLAVIENVEFYQWLEKELNNEDHT